MLVLFETPAGYALFKASLIFFYLNTLAFFFYCTPGMVYIGIVVLSLHVIGFLYVGRVWGEHCNIFGG